MRSLLHAIRPARPRLARDSLDRRRTHPLPADACRRRCRGHDQDLDEPGAVGRTFEAGGNEIFSFRELIERLCGAIGHRPWLVPIPFALAEAGACLAQWLPHAPLTVDQVRLLKTDKIIRDPQSSPAALGVNPRPLESFLSELGKEGPA